VLSSGQIDRAVLEKREGKNPSKKKKNWSGVESCVYYYPAPPLFMFVGYKMASSLMLELFTRGASPFIFAHPPFQNVSSSIPD
jgi:hypothetical protein